MAFPFMSQLLAFEEDYSGNGGGLGVANGASPLPAFTAAAATAATGSVAGHKRARTTINYGDVDDSDGRRGTARDAVAAAAAFQDGEGDGEGSDAAPAPHFKVAFDPIHSYIQLDAPTLAIVDTPEFQRLRDLKQLGTCYFVFPGASHNRFEHSLGVSHLSGSMIDHFMASQPGLAITAEEASYVRIAGLVHDLGHGPFSHVFDGQFIPTVRPGLSWHHEQMSAALLDVLLDDNEITCLDGVYTPGDGDGELPSALRGSGRVDITGRDVVKYMLHPDEPDASALPEAGPAYRARLSREGRGLLWANSREFLFEIVANATTGIDTDKFDYLARDSHNLGLSSSFDHRRVLYSSRVMPNGHVAYHAKETMAIR